MTTTTTIPPTKQEPSVIETADLVITGIHCWECSAHLELAIEAFPGVETARIDAGSGATTLCYRRGELDIEALLSAIMAEPYGVRLISIRLGD